LRSHPATDSKSYAYHAEGCNIGTPPPVSRGFIALYTVANIGAYIAFVPLLQILVPLRAVAIDPAHSAALLSQVALWGAVAASLTNILFGALSDRTNSTRGRRQPWIYGGLVAVLASYAVLARAGSPAALAAGIIAFQFAFNALFAPLAAILADDVPDRQKGLMAALLGLGYPLGSVIGAHAVGRLAIGETARFAVTGLLVALLIVPFAWHLGRHTRTSAPAAKAAAAAAGEPPASATANPLTDLDFVRVLAGRLLVAISFSLVQGYLLLYLRNRVAVPGFFAGTPESAFATLAAVATAANITCALLGGWWSDRGGRRSHFVFGAGTVMACGIAALALAPSWGAMRAAMVLYGCGAGVYYAVDLALIVDILPSLRNAGKDLGIVNLTNTIPQIVAPLIGLALIHGASLDFHALFLAGAAAAALGAGCVLGVKPKPSGQSR
jgi:MFS family permease